MARRFLGFLSACVALAAASDLRAAGPGAVGPGEAGAATLQVGFRDAGSAGWFWDVRGDGLPPQAEGGTVLVQVYLRNRLARDVSRRLRVRGGCVAGSLGPFPPLGPGSLPPGVYVARLCVDGQCAAAPGTLLCGTRVEWGDEGMRRAHVQEATRALSQRIARTRAVHEEMTALLARIADPAFEAEARGAWGRDSPVWFRDLYAVRDGIEGEWREARAPTLSRSNDCVLEAIEAFRWVVRDKAEPLGLAVLDPENRKLSDRFAGMTPEEREAALVDYLARAGRVLRDGIPEMENLFVMLERARALWERLAPVWWEKGDAAVAPPPPAGELVPGTEAWWEAWARDLETLKTDLEPLAASEELLDENPDVVPFVPVLLRLLEDASTLLRTGGAPDPGALDPLRARWEDLIGKVLAGR